MRNCFDGWGGVDLVPFHSVSIVHNRIPDWIKAHRQMNGAEFDKVIFCICMVIQ